MRNLTLEVYTPEERMPEDDRCVLFRLTDHAQLFCGFYKNGIFNSYIPGSRKKDEIAEWAYMP